MKTNIVVSAVRVNGYWYLRVKYDENNCRVRYQQSTGLKIDQSYRKVEQARRRVLAELYEINRMDEQCEKVGHLTRAALSAGIRMAETLAR